MKKIKYSRLKEIMDWRWGEVVGLNEIDSGESY